MEPVSYLEDNKDWFAFSRQVSDNTGVVFNKLWPENAKKNREMVKEYGWAIPAMQNTCEGKTAIIMGASPAIQHQVETLRGIQHDPDFVLIGIQSGLSFLLKNGIKPKYVFVADAAPEATRFWEDLDMTKTKDITLIPNLCIHQDVLKMWQGDMKFLAVQSTTKKLDVKLRKWYKPVNGIGHYFHALASQYNTAVAFAFTVLNCQILIFVGSELSFKDKEATYYVDRKDKKDAFNQKPHIDIYGNTVYTTYSFMSLKLALEDYLGKVSGAGWFFNCTEAGILGVSKRYGNLSWIHQFTLKMGIAQARQIMKTGEPFYL